MQLEEPVDGLQVLLHYTELEVSQLIRGGMSAVVVAN